MLTFSSHSLDNLPPRERPLDAVEMANSFYSSNASSAGDEEINNQQGHNRESRSESSDGNNVLFHLQGEKIESQRT